MVGYRGYYLLCKIPLVDQDTDNHSSQGSLLPKATIFSSEWVDLVSLSSYQLLIYTGDDHNHTNYNPLGIRSMPIQSNS